MRSKINPAWNLFAAAALALAFVACDAGTEVEEAELGTGTETMVAEEEPAWDTEMGMDVGQGSPVTQATMADLDTNQDDQVTRDEFETWFDQEVWNDWDADADDQVAMNEAAESFWGWWDENGDGAVDQQEYQTASNVFAFEGVEYDDFAQVAGDDQRWSREEFEPWFEQNLWTGWDADSNQELGRQEAGDAFWQWWDENGDDQVDAEEIARFGGDEMDALGTTADTGAEVPSEVGR